MAEKRIKIAIRGDEEEMSRRDRGYVSIGVRLCGLLAGRLLEFIDESVVICGGGTGAYYAGKPWIGPAASSSSMSVWVGVERGWRRVLLTLRWLVDLLALLGVVVRTFRAGVLVA